MSATLGRLSPPQARSLALGLLAVVIVAVLAAVLVPVVLLHRHYNEAIDEAADRLHRYQRVAAQAPELAKALDSVRERNGRRFFLRNTAVNLAAAELSERVKSAVEGNGGRITTSQNVQPKDDDRFKQIGSNVQFFATHANLQRILASLESQLPHVVVSNLTVRPVNAFRGFKPAPGQDPDLVVQMDAVAWALPEPVRPPAPSAKPPAPNPAKGKA